MTKDDIKNQVSSYQVRIQKGFAFASLFLPAFLITLGLYLSSENREKIKNAKSGLADFSEQTLVYFDALSHMPIVGLGWVFGLLGGFFRLTIQKLRKEETPDLSLIFLQVGAGGIIGIMATLIIDSSLINLFVKDKASLDLKLSFEGVALISFIFAYFTAEITAKAKLRFLTKDEAE